MRLEVIQNTHHDRWPQEKAYVTGLEAANQVIATLGQGQPAKILPVIADEPQIQALRSVNRWVRQGCRGCQQQ